MQQFVAPMIYVLAFVAVFLVIQAVAGLVIASNDQNKRVNRRLTMLDAGGDPDQVFASLVRRAPAPKLGDPSLLRWHERAETWLHQAGLGLSPTRLLAVTGARRPE